MLLKAWFYFIWVLMLGSHSYANMGESLEQFQKSSFETPVLLSNRNLSQYNFVLVGGYMNEAARDHYMVLNAEFLKKMGAGAVSTLFPSSLSAVSSNRQMLAEKFIEIYQSGGEKPLILIGHSKGGLEVLATILAFPQFVENKIVSTAILVQAPLLGNAFLDRQGFAGKLVSTALGFSPGHHSLSTNEINKVISGQLEKLPSKTRATLSRAVKYVVSEQAPEQFSRALKISSLATKIDIEYDGLVAKHDMWLTDFGTVIGDLKADHLEYVLGKETFLGDKYNPKKVGAFTMALVLHALRSRNSSHASEYRDLTNKLDEQRRANPLCERKLMGF